MKALESTSRRKALGRSRDLGDKVLQHVAFTMVKATQVVTRYTRLGVPLVPQRRRQRLRWIELHRHASTAPIGPVHNLHSLRPLQQSQILRVKTWWKMDDTGRNRIVHLQPGTSFLVKTYRTHHSRLLRCSRPDCCPLHPRHVLPADKGRRN